MQKNGLRKIFLVVSLMFITSILANAQTISGKKYVVGGRLGLSFLDGTAGLQIGPTGTYYFDKNMGISSDFNINTQGGTPIEWNGSFVYNLKTQKQDMQPYLDGGMSLWFYTGGPYFGFRFGGGVNFKIAPNIYIPADAQFGPVFGGGTTVFYFAITSGIRYALP